jgi:L,D-peptidoglycan transpeptidase YkuD (ErfK/YbiS/YcfS/YnhG family)
MRRALIRPGVRQPSRLPWRFTRPADGWCDDPFDRNYNRPVRLPYPASAEAVWRDDELYDLLVVLGYNDSPRRREAGSAIFFHLADPGGRPTRGCIAVSRRDMMKVLALCGPKTRIKVW